MGVECESCVCKKAETYRNNEAGKVCQGLVCSQYVDATGKHDPVDQSVENADRCVLGE